MCVYFVGLPNFSAAVTPKPTTVIYMKQSNIFSFTSNVQNVSAVQLAINITNAINPINRLLDTLASLDSIDIKKFIFTLPY